MGGPYPEYSSRVVARDGLRIWAWFLRGTRPRGGVGEPPDYFGRNGSSGRQRVRHWTGVSATDRAGVGGRYGRGARCPGVRGRMRSLSTGDRGLSGGNEARGEGSEASVSVPCCPYASVFS